MWAKVPVVPDAEEARRWAEEELSRSIYHEQISWWEALMRRLMEALIRPLTTTSGSLGSFSGVVIMAALIILVIVIIVFASRLRRNQRAKVSAKQSAKLFTDDADSLTLFQRAEQAAARHDYTLAFLEYFRAIIRAADERALIHDRVGLTAQEAAQLVSKLPASDPIGEFAATFDAASYGDEQLTAAKVRQLQQWGQTALAQWRKLSPQVDVGETAR